MSQLRTILTEEEKKFFRDEKRSIIKGFRRQMQWEIDSNVAPDRYKNWLTWRLIAMIEKIDERATMNFNTLLRVKCKK